MIIQHYLLEKKALQIKTKNAKNEYGHILHLWKINNKKNVVIKCTKSEELVHQLSKQWTLPYVYDTKYTLAAAK